MNWQKLLLSLVLVMTLQPPMAHADELAEALNVLSQLDGARIVADYRNEPIGQVLTDLNARLPVPLRADWEALRRLGIDEEKRISLRVPGSNGSSLLSALALTLGDEFERPIFEAHAGQMVLTTLRATEAMRLTALYDVRDLLSHDSLMQQLREAAPSPMGAGDSTPPGAADGETLENDEHDDDNGANDREEPLVFPEPAPAPGGPLPPRHRRNPLKELDNAGAPDGAKPHSSPSPGERLINLITDHVDPEAWMNFGGSRAKISDQAGVLLVTATPTTHRQLAGALRTLRAAVSQSIRVQAVLIDLPHERLESLSRQFDGRPTALVQAVLSDGSTIRRWQSQSPATVGQPLNLETQTGDSSIRLALKAAANPKAGLCELDVNVSMSQEGARRSAQTIISIAGDERGAFIELPATQPADPVRLLVLLIDRG